MRSSGSPPSSAEAALAEVLFATLVTSIGPVTIRLYERDTPLAVRNFVDLATGAKAWRHPVTGASMQGTGLYDGTFFHRVIPNFMVQAGDPFSRPDGDPARLGTGNPGYRFADEFLPHLRFDRPGLVAMANGGPRTNGSQFFITEVATPHLNGKHTIFGEVERNFALVPKIARRPADSRDCPLDPVRIERVIISRGLPSLSPSSL